MATCKYEHNGQWYTEDELKKVFLQERVQAIPKASAKTIKRVREFLDRIDVNVEVVSKIKVGNETLGINGLADALNSLIQIAEGKEDVALTEEAAHFAVELIEQKDPKLFKQMLDAISSYRTYITVSNNYRNLPYYQKDGKPDILKLKKEAIGKVLAENINRISEALPENPTLLSKLKEWWDKVIKFLKNLFLQAQFNPFEETAAKIVKGEENLGTAASLSSTPFANMNETAIRATLKIVQSLGDSKAERWFNDLYKKGDKKTFFTKLQQDLQAPKNQVDLLEQWTKVNDPQSVGDMIVGILAELSFPIKIRDGSDNLDLVEDNLTDDERFDRAEEAWLREPGDNTRNHYSSLTVPGGTNYSENELYTPDITPSIKGHAAFTSEKGIGWFRSDDKTNATGKITEGNRRAAEAFDIQPEPDEKVISKTRRILEVQSDLFQRGRDLNNLVVGNIDKKIAEEYGEDYVSQISEKYRKEYDKSSISKNEFLQLLNKENNWVTFFIKSIIQDSARKGYEKIRFPSGNTANKIEGQETLENFVKDRQDRIREGEKDLKDLIYNGRFEEGGSFYKVENGKYYVTNISIGGNFTQEQEISREQYHGVKAKAEHSYRVAISEYKRELKDAQEGRNKFAIINRFYEKDIFNILTKQGYNPQRVTDEYKNDWFEVDIKPTRDLGMFYFQVQGQGDLIDRLKEVDRDVSINQQGDYEINGNKIRNTVFDKVLDYFKRRLGPNATKVFNSFKKDTEKNVNKDIKDILDRYIDDDGKARLNPLPHANPSAIDPYDNTFYNSLESHFKDLIATYPPGTTFFKSVNVYNDRIKTAGTIDLLSIMPDNKIDILQFRLPEFPRGAKDVPLYRQEAYNIEIEGLRNILQGGYNIDRSLFRQTRVIPIKAEYQYAGPGAPIQLISLIIGNKDVTLIQDDILLPIPSVSEGSGNAKFDEAIRRLRGLARKLSEEKVPPDKRLEKTQRVASLLSAIRKLQVKGEADGIISSAKTILKRQKEKFSSLQTLLPQVDPNIATIEELNKIADEILDDKDQVEIYRDLYEVFKSVYTDGSTQSERYKAEARDISEEARDVLDNYLQMSIDFRKTKLSAKMGIKDEFEPEINLSWYRRTVRSLSQSSTKAGAQLWELVKRINNAFQLQFQNRIGELKQIEGEVDKWLIGKNIKDLYNKIFQIDKDGRWNGRVVQKYSKDFYSNLRRAQEARDYKWVQDNIDINAYNAWLKQEHADRVANSATARVHEDDAENSRIIAQSLQDFVDTFSLATKTGVNTNNYKLKEFPREDLWKSDEYKELEKPENKAILDLYNYWIKRLQESIEEGVIQDHYGWSWFPNIRRDFTEKISTAKSGNKLSSLLGIFKLEPEDIEFGKIDPITGKPIDEIHANFVSDLGAWVKDANGRYFLDYGEKSMDIFRVIAFWDKEILQYKLRSESEALARMLMYTEQNKDAYQTTKSGRRLKTDPQGNPIIISNDINFKYIKDHVDAFYYGKRRDMESDFTIKIRTKSAIEKVNKLFGRELITVPKEEYIEISGTKALDTMNRYFVAKTLGLNIMTAGAQLFGGTINTFINNGTYFDKKDLLAAEIEYTTGKFWGSDENRKVAGLLGYLHPYAEDRTGQYIRNLSVSHWVRFLSSDHLFYLQRGSDNWVNSIVAIAYIRNTMVDNGKLVNIREYAKKELGYNTKYQGTYQQSKEFQQRLEARIEELKKSPQALINQSQIVNDRIVITGVDRESQTVYDMRQIILEIIKDALGNTSAEDLALYKRQVIWQSFFMYKNWIPRMLDKRFQSLKFSPGTQKYEWGRVVMLLDGLRHMSGSRIGGLIRQLGGNDESVVEAAKKSYKEKQAEFAAQRMDFDMDEAEFIDMYIKGVRSEFKEIMLAIALIGLLIAMRLGSPDRDEDPQVKGAYNWLLRGMDKLVDEVSFFYSPKSFTDIVNGSIFPSVSLLVDIEKFLSTAIQKLFYITIGDEKSAEKKHPLKYVFKLFPISKEAITYWALFDEDVAKDYGIRISSQSGSFR